MSTADNPPPVKPEQVPASSPPAPETAAGPADPSNGIQESAGAPAGEPIPLPPLPQREPPSPARFARALFRLDAVLVALVLLFAFLVASFPAYNGDFFLHAATGRLIAQGKYTFGADPFTFTAPGRWVNHSWLYDLIVYAVYQVPLIGGAAVVVVKALLIAALAAVMLRAGRKPGASLWVPAVCTALALLTLSPRLFLQPVCVSYLFLGLTLWLLGLGLGVGWQGEVDV